MAHKLQYEALRKLASLNNFQKCPHCEVKGGLYKAHDPGATGWTLWCYTCSWKLLATRRSY